jgi:hypothetical protein
MQTGVDPGVFQCDAASGPGSFRVFCLVALQCGTPIQYTSAPFSKTGLPDGALFLEASRMRDFQGEAEFQSR